MFIARKAVGLSLEAWGRRKALEKFITEYIPNVRTIIS